MGNKKQRIIPAHYSWNSSIITRGIIDPIKRKLGWVDENEHPVSLKESATGQELDRIKDTAKDAGKLVATGLAFSNPVTSSTVMAPLITGSQAYFMSEGLKDAYDRVASSNKTAADGAMVALDIAGAVPAVSAAVNGAKYVLPTVAKTVTPVLITKQISKTKLPIVEPTLNIGWGPKQTLKVSRAGEYDQMYFPERWDVVNEGANPHGVWLQGKYGTPRTEATNPGKGIKAARARNIFSTRSDKYTGTVTLDKPIVTVGEVPNRSSLSYQADNIGADGLIYNGVYDNGYNNNQVILSFRRPELTKIQLSEAELKGVPKSIRNQSYKKGYRTQHPDDIIIKDTEKYKKAVLDLYNSKIYRDRLLADGYSEEEINQYLNNVLNLDVVKKAPVVYSKEIPMDDNGRTLWGAAQIHPNLSNRPDGGAETIIHELQHLSEPNSWAMFRGPKLQPDGFMGVEYYAMPPEIRTRALSTLRWLDKNNIDIQDFYKSIRNYKDIPGDVRQFFLAYPEKEGLNYLLHFWKNGGILKRVESGKSGIHIKPENRGKFTALKKRTGKSST